MPKFLEAKLKQEYGAKSATPYKVMNAIGAMRGNKESPKGAAMESKHEAKTEHMREMRIQFHRNGNKLTGVTVHHYMMPKGSKSSAFIEHTQHSQQFGAGQHEAMMDHVHEHTAMQMPESEE